MMKIRDANGKFEYDSLVENKYLDQVMYGMSNFCFQTIWFCIK